MHVDLTQQPHLHAVARHAADPRRPEGADHAAAVLFAPARQRGAGLRHLRRPCARDAAANTPRVSDGKIKLEFYDPEPFSDTEDRALAYGLQGVPVDQGGDQVYFGLAGSNLEDDERTIAFFQPERERFLEYDLTKLVYELSNPKRPVVGVMSSLPLDGDPRAMMMARRPRRRRAALCIDHAAAADQPGEDGATDAQVIDPDIQVLLVAEAQNLSDATLYAIDQFVMRGGRLMVMVDPWSEAMAADPSPERHAADRHQLQPEEAVRCLGHRVRSDQGGRRPDRRLAGARQSRRPRAGGQLRRLVQHPRRHQPRRPGDRRSAAGDRRLGRRAARRRRMHRSSSRRC